jgi:succinate-semialdehyde dehydrogenase/glutarate-semialdehyde dehydrogenase
MPWNFPFWQVVRAAVPALLAGNGVLLKHASSVPGCAGALEAVFAEAGLPNGLFQNIYLPHALTEDVLRHPAVAALTLTGSERAGQEVGMLAAKYLKKSVLELGGSDAFVVLADADVAAAAKAAATSRLINNGQSCVAAKRFIVEAPVYEAFADAFCQHLAAARVGDPMDKSTQLGPLISQQAALHLQEQVDKSLALGATLRLKGGNTYGAFFNPTVLENVHPGQPAFDEEFFGPAASLFKVKDADEALAIANASPYGLGGAVWTADLDKGRAFARQMQTGGVYLNSIMKSDPALPFGGVKRSGHGRELSTFGLHEFVNVQTLVG